MKYKLYIANKMISGRGSVNYDEDSIRLLKGYGAEIVKDEDGFEWLDMCKAYVEIKTLNDLNEFIDYWGEIIIDAEKITIYNGYVE